MSTDNTNPSDAISKTKAGVALIGEIIKAAGDNPNVKEAANNLGRTAVTITEALNNVLLPVAAINFAFNKARDYFANDFANDLSSKAETIPPERFIEPSLSIAGPAVQGLAFSHDEPNLKDMYLSLLVAAMDSHKSSLAHPAFVEIIKQLSSEEASILKKILDDPQGLEPIIQVWVKHGLFSQTYHHITKHLMNLVDPTTGTEISPDKIAGMVDNWLRLGLVEVDYQKSLTGDDDYSWVESSIQIAEMRKEFETKSRTIKFQHGILGITTFGFQFARAIGVISDTYSPKKLDDS